MGTQIIPDDENYIPCSSPEHNPPNIIIIPPDSKMIHTCPRCGQVTRITNRKFCKIMKNPPEFPLCRFHYEGLEGQDECPKCKSNFYRTTFERLFGLFIKPKSTKCINPDCPNAFIKSTKL